MSVSTAQTNQTTEIRIPPVFEPLWYPHLNRWFLWGGRQSAKSVSVARRLVELATSKRMRVACIRQTRTTADDSQRVELTKAIGDYGWDALWSTTQTSELVCRNGSKFLLRGLKGQSGLRSLADIDAFWAEEGQLIEDPGWSEFINTIIRKPGLLIFVTGNPRYSTDPVYNWCYERKEAPGAWWNFSTYRDNPFMSEEADAERRIQQERGVPTYDHEWEGKLLSDGLSKVLPYDHLEACIRLWERDQSEHRFYHERHMGFDPADGGDNSVVASRVGPFLEHMERVKHDKDDPSKAVRRLHELMMRHGGRIASYDVGGIGRLVPVYYNERPPVDYDHVRVEFGSKVGGEDVLYDGLLNNKERFERKNAQMAWNLKDRAHNSWLRDRGSHMPLQDCLVIDPTCFDGKEGAPTEKQFMDAMTQPEWEYVGKRTIRIDKAPRDLPSPDEFDATCLAFHEDVRYGLRLRVE